MAVRNVHRTTAHTSEMNDVVVVVNQLAALANELKADFNALLTKLDADAGVTDTNYSSLRSVAAADSDTIVLGY